MNHNSKSSKINLKQMKAEKREANLERLENPFKASKRLENILKAGIEIVLEEGANSLTFRAVAEKLGMYRSNVLRYVDSKRDLWLAIRFTLYNDFIILIDDGVGKYKEMNKSYHEILLKTAKIFLDYATENYNRFQMIFLLDPPESDKIGKIEKNLDYDLVAKFFFKLVKEAVNAKELRESDAIKTYYSVVSLLVGSVRNEIALKRQMDITEPLNIKSEIDSIETYRNFILEKVKEILDSGKP